MTRLILLRHAKSDWSDEGQDDHARPLNARGRAAAGRIGRYLREHDIAPDLVVCSTAQRTRDTVAIALSEAGLAPRIVYDPALYLSAPEHMLKAALAHADGAECVMIVGHNPGTEGLAAKLARAGDPALIAKLRAKYPTGGLAVFTCADGFAGLPGNARLDAYVVPRDLS